MIVDAIVVAAGVGQRFGGDLPKQYAQLAGAPILLHSAERLQAHPGIRRVIVVIHQDHRALYKQVSSSLVDVSAVIGGPTRQHSVWAGLEALAKDEQPDAVLIHDGARPCLGNDVLERVLCALQDHQAVLPAIKVTDSLKQERNHTVIGEVDRTNLVRAQTPQGFNFAMILDAHRRLAPQSFTDDTALARELGIEVHIVEGDRNNIKITENEDFAVAEAVMRTKVIDVARTWRTGSGFDVHRFGQRRPLILCGIAIPFKDGLIGHSDADVALHALTDAVLGTICAGDIGDHFPPTDPVWRDADSSQFLAHANSLIGERSGRLEHVDLTIICEQPKIGPHRQAMIERIAAVLGIAPDHVSVKATTTEGLGFTGRGEGIAAQAIATASFPSNDFTQP